MNDRLKFRMYDTNVNKMYMPNDFGGVESIYECLKQQINWDLDAVYDIKFNHLEDGRFFMQCTGLKDKNGKLIYEGDIVKDEHNAWHYVKWVYDSWQLFPCTQNNYTKCIVDDDIEVIGNIYENKELLQEDNQ